MQLPQRRANLFKSLPGSGMAVLNADDPHVVGMQHLTDAKVLTYGLSEQADVRASEIRVVLARAPFSDHYLSKEISTNQHTSIW